MMLRRLLSTSSAKNLPIVITQGAWGKMEEISKKQHISQFLFSASSGGCNGYNYELTLIEKEEFDEIIVENTTGRIKPTTFENNNIDFLVDPVAEMILIGTTVDFVTEDYSKGIFESKFTFTPDKEIAASCGCGVSFSPRDSLSV